MSAIFGLYRRDGEPVDAGELAGMAAILAHRGPDHTGMWRAGPVSLGGCMLRTTPESLRERLPVVSADGEVVVTADARIDNREELATTLGLAAGARGETSDSALILAAYERWGEACPEKLLGDFAFAVWDGRRRVLLCARDPLGVRPLCYYESPGVFAFASELKALLSLPWLPRRVNEVRVGDHLVPLFEDTAITFYRDVSRLPAAHRLAVRPGSMRLGRYWALDPSREVRLRSDGEYAEGFRHHFREAVRCRLRSASPVAALLSGGLDSSSIVGTARQLLDGDGARVRTFSAVFPSLREADRRIDERSYIEAVVAEGGVEAHYVRADQVSPLPPILWGEEEAIPAPNLYMDYALLGAAHEQGVRVLLSGWDGDSTVSHGLELLPELARRGRWMRLGREVRALSSRLSNRAATPGRIAWEFGFRPLVPELAVRGWRALAGRDGYAPIAPVNLEFARRIGLRERVRFLSGPGSGLARTARVDHYRSLASGVLVYGLELLDKVAASRSLELRYPFCDRRLIEFCLALPAEQKLRDGWSRAVMRGAMRDVLPPEVSARVHKGNLSASFKRRLLEHERGTLDRIMMAGEEPVWDYVDIAALRAAYRRYVAEPLQREQEALAVFLGVTLALWLRQTRVSGSPVAR